MEPVQSELKSWTYYLSVVDPFNALQRGRDFCNVLYIDCDFTCTNTIGYQFLNSGFIGGYVKDLVDFFEDINCETCNDQDAAAHMFIKHRKIRNYTLV